MLKKKEQYVVAVVGATGAVGNEMIDTLEKDTGLPAVYTKTANVWRCLQLAGIKEPIYGFGRLLEMDRQVITS